MTSFILNGELSEAIPTPLTIFDALKAEESVPPGFNCVKILVDGRINSDLDWKDAQAAARKYTEQGLKLFWELDLGLFERLQWPLSDQAQYLALQLSIDHFRDIIWKEFQADTIGLCIYRGDVNFSKQLIWNEQQESSLQGWLKDHFKDTVEFNNDIGLSYDQFTEVEHHLLGESTQGLKLLNIFCRDVVAEFLALLATRLPDGLQPFVFFDVQATIQDQTIMLAQLISKERFERFNFGITENIIFLQTLTQPALGYMSRQHLILPSLPPRNVGFCLPLASHFFPKHENCLQLAMREIKNNQISFRLIPEAVLTTEWDGLDFLIVIPSCVSSTGMRKLHGFCAAGGVVVSLGDQIGLSNEQSFSKWMSNF